MITATSCSKNKFKNLYLGTIRRYMGVSIFYLILALVLYPLLYLLEILSYQQQELPYSYFPFYGHGAAYSGIIGFTMPLMSIVIPILFGTMVFSFLHNKRATDVFHSLPVKREKLFAAHYLAGLTIINVPIILDFLLVIGMSAANQNVFNGQFYPGRMVQEMLGWVIMTSVIYTITCFAAVLAGTAFDTVVLSLAMCCIIPALLFTVVLASESFLLGFFNFSVGGLLDFENIVFYTPFAPMIVHLVTDIIPGMSSGGIFSGNSQLFRNSNVAIFCWLITAVLLLAASVYLYKKRKSEVAGRANSMTLPTKIIQYIATFICGILSGVVLYEVFSDNTILAFLGVLLGGGISFAAYEAVMARGFRTFPKAFIHMGISVGASLVFVLILQTGGFGFESRIPAAEEIASVQINYTGRYERPYSYNEKFYQRGVVLSDPKSIEIVRSFHEATYKELKGLAQKEDTTVTKVFAPLITYQLKNGKTFTRNYSSISVPTAFILSELENQQEFKVQTNPAYLLKEGEFSYITLHDRFGSDDKAISPQINLTKNQQKLLLEALKKDIDQETVEDILSGVQPICYLSFGLSYDDLEKSSSEAYPGSRDILITAKYKNTLKYLGKELGLQEILNTMGEEYSPENIKIERTAVFAPSYKPWNGLHTGYVYHAYGEFMELESFVFEDADRHEWITDISQEEAYALYESAYNQVGNPSGIGLNVYFDIEGQNQSMMLYVPYEKAPELVERYMSEDAKQEYGFFTGGQKTDANAIVVLN